MMLTSSRRLGGRRCEEGAVGVVEANARRLQAETAGNSHTEEGFEHVRLDWSVTLDSCACTVGRCSPAGNCSRRSRRHTCPSM